jgi:hypothetical protein
VVLHRGRSGGRRLAARGEVTHIPQPERTQEHALATSKLGLQKMAGMKMFHLLGADGQMVMSPTKGILGGHRRTKVYGQMECPSARRALANGGYRQDRVFFADEATAVAAGFRPCHSCMPVEYQAWKERSAPAAHGDGRSSSDGGLSCPRPGVF